MSDYLMTNICYKEVGDKEWKGFSITDGDPTGRIYDFWLPNDIRPVMSDIVKYLNSEITCIYEKPINPVALKFKLRKRPSADSPVFGYIYEEYWETLDVIFEDTTKSFTEHT